VQRGDITLATINIADSTQVIGSEVLELLCLVNLLEVLCTVNDAD
jgi:hypothetical protein